MASENAEAAFTSEDLRHLEEIQTQLTACRSVSEQTGRGKSALSIFLKITDEKMTGFVKDFRDRIKAAGRMP